MKRLLAAAMLITVLALSEPIQAADLGGFYIAPKFFWSHQMQDNSKITTDWMTPQPTSFGVRSTSTDAWGGALALGYDFKSGFGLPIRAELEYAARSQAKGTTMAGPDDVDKTVLNSRKINVNTLFANVFYDFNTGTSFTPYIGGGIGLASISVRDTFSDGYFGLPTAPFTGRKNVTNFAWNLSAGVAYSFDSHWTLDLGYRYSNFGRVKGAQVTDGYEQHQAKSEPTAHEVLLGLRYTF